MLRTKNAAATTAITASRTVGTTRALRPARARFVRAAWWAVATASVSSAPRGDGVAFRGERHGESEGSVLYGLLEATAEQGDALPHAQQSETT